MAVTALSGQRWQGQLGSAGSAELDGTNDYIDLGGSATTYNFLTAGSFSIACWIKITPAHDKILFDNSDSNTANVGITYIIEGAGGGYQITGKLNRGGSGSDSVTTAVWGTTDWQHFCSTYDGTTMKIYRNGTEVASDSMTSSSSDQSYVPRIGWGANGNKGKLTGNISDFLITNDVLSATEISDLQTTAVSDVSPAISNQQVHYKFTENFNDSSGNSRNATATGSEISTSVYKFPKPDDKTTVTDVPVGSEFEQTDNYKSYQRMASPLPMPTGLTASSYGFDCTDTDGSYMVVDQGTNLFVSDDMTWSVWFYPTALSNEIGIWKNAVTSSSSDYSVWCYLTESERYPKMGIRSSGGVRYGAGDVAPTLNKWNLLTVSYDYSAGTMKMYMNGSALTMTESGTTSGSLNSSTNIRFFSNTPTSSTPPDKEDLDGYVAEIAMWEDYWSDITNHTTLWNSYSQSTNAGGKSCNDLGTTLNNKLRWFYTGEYANTTGDVILNQADGTSAVSALKGTPTNLSRLDGADSWKERGTA